MYRSKYAVFVKNFSLKIARKDSVYAALSHFCVIITRASILLTIPVAFIYKISLLYKFVLLVSVKQGDLYLQLIFEKHIIIKDLERWVTYNEKQHTYFWGQLFNL